MNEYELTVLIHPDLETDLDAPLSVVRKLVTGNGGEIVSEEAWGKKRLAYRIKNQDFAVYQYFDLKLPADAPLKISTTLNITDGVMRYLLVRTDLKGRALLADAKERGDHDDQSEE